MLYTPVCTIKIAVIDQLHTGVSVGDLLDFERLEVNKPLGQHHLGLQNGALQGGMGLLLNARALSCNFQCCTCQAMPRCCLYKAFTGRWATVVQYMSAPTECKLHRACATLPRHEGLPFLMYMFHDHTTRFPGAVLLACCMCKYCGLGCHAQGLDRQQ